MSILPSVSFRAKTAVELVVSPMLTLLYYFETMLVLFRDSCVKIALVVTLKLSLY